jgi:exodeoxyribonuclease V alpha subunit
MPPGNPGPDAALPHSLQRNLLYAGITRGKRLVVRVGQKKAIAIAVRNVSARRRWSKLDEWLRGGAPSRSSN